MQLGKYFGSGIRRFFSGMALSRVSGLGRDLMMAYAFGDHPAVAAFIVAFRFANVLRRFFGEGPLQAAFIPQFEGLRGENQESAYLFFRKLTVVIGGIVLLLVGVGQGLLTFWKGSEIGHLTSWMLPSLFFISLYGLNVSFLQCHNRFFVSSMAPFLCNMMWICGAFFLRDREATVAMVGLAKWVFAGFVLQWGITAWQMRKELGRGKWLSSPLFHGEVKRLAGAFSLGALGVGATQINAFFDALFARAAHLSGPVYLWYANRFYQLALAIFGIAAVNTLVPVLSRAIKKGDHSRAQGIFAFGCQKMSAIMVPMTCAILCLGFGAIHLVFGRGHFSLYAVDQTAQCLSAYGLGLLPATLVMFYAAVLYAEGNFRTSTWISISAVGLNLGLNSLFIFGMGWGPVATAFATSIGAWCNFLALMLIVRKKGFTIGHSWKGWGFLLCGSGVAAFLIAVLMPVLRETTTNKVLLFGIPGLLYVSVCGALFWKRFFYDYSGEGGGGEATSS